MSEEKLYAVKNDEGKYLLMDSTPCWDDKAGTAIKRSARALGWAKIYGGHVVTLIEEPKKVVLTKEQAEIVERAHDATWPATYISGSTGNSDGEESLLIEAYVNGYTVAKEKKYLVYKVLGGKQDKDNLTEYVQAFRSYDHPETMFWVLTKWLIDEQSTRLSENEISDFGLQDCEKEEVTDDDD